MRERESFHWQDDPGDSNDHLSKDDQFNPDMEGQAYHEVSEDNPDYEIIVDGEPDIYVSDMEDQVSAWENYVDSRMALYQRLSTLVPSTEKFIRDVDMKLGQEYTIEFYHMSNPLNERQEFQINMYTPLILRSMKDSIHKDLLNEGEIGEGIIHLVDTNLKHERD